MTITRGASAAPSRLSRFRRRPKVSSTRGRAASRLPGRKRHDLGGAEQREVVAERVDVVAVGHDHDQRSRRVHGQRRRNQRKARSPRLRPKRLRALRPGLLKLRQSPAVLPAARPAPQADPAPRESPRRRYSCAANSIRVRRASKEKYLSQWGGGGRQPGCPARRRQPDGTDRWAEPPSLLVRGLMISEGARRSAGWMLSNL